MKKRQSKKYIKKTGLLICSILIIGVLIILNRDLFHFELIKVYRRSFSADQNSKGDYILSDQFVLKPGEYKLIVDGNFQKRGNGIFLIDSANNKIFSTDLPEEGTTFETEFTVTLTTQQLRFGVTYDPSTEDLIVDRFIVSSDHIIYKSSILKHSVLSLLTIIIGVLISLRIVYPNKYNNLFPHISKPENERMILIIIFLTILTSIPFFDDNSYIKADDFYYHMRHLEGIASSIKADHFPARILLGWLQNYGYGSGFYYPNLLLTFPALLILLGFHVITAYEVFVSICTFTSLLTMFLTVRRISKSEKSAYCSVILYAFAAYRLADIYYRAALGEIQVFAFLPLIVLGLYEIFNDHPERWWIFAIGFTSVLWSHVISLALSGLFTAIWALFHVKRILTDKAVFLSLLKAFLLTLALGAWFLLPMAEQTATNQLRINTIISMDGGQPYGSYNETKSLLLFFDDWNYNIVRRRVYPGWPLLLIPILRVLFLRRKNNSLLKLADQLTIYGMITMIMCTNLFPWKYFLWLLYRIQFAWRIMMISTVLLTISSAIYAEYLINKILSQKSTVFQVIPVFILCMICGAPILIESITNRAMPMDYYRYIEPSNHLSGGEYLPVKLTQPIIQETGDHVISDSPGFELLSFSRKGLSVTFNYQLPEGNSNVIMQVPLIFYTGYRAYYSSEKIQEYEIPVSKNELGLITVTNEGHSEGTVTVRYEKTIMQHIGDTISLITLAGCIFIGIKRRLFRKKTSYQHQASFAPGT